MTNEQKNNDRVERAAKSGTVKLTAIVAATTMLIGASFGVQAIAESKMYQHAKFYMNNSETADQQSFVQKAGWGKHRRGGRHGMRFSEMSDAEIEKKITRAVKHVSIEIDATDEQEAKITALVTAVAKDLKPLHGDFKAAGDELHNLLTADTIDRAAIEKIRAERVAEADRVSKELVNALADVAEVLTPEQRKIVDERLEQFKSMRGRWRRG
ncbi:MAG: periplasmic heavy metal sensor [Rhizobiaceae bacterium]|nr:periplasmic heavy metal sensor [Rhizobiaceae bacterium]